MSASGIYAITHLATGKQYIGSSNNLEKRWQEHQRTLRLGIHKNRYLQRAWRQCGEAAFSFTVLETVPDLDDLVVREQYHLDERRKAIGNNGYNLSPTAYSNRGVKHGPAVRAKYRAAKLGHKQTPEQIAKRRATFMNRPKTEKELAYHTRGPSGRKMPPRSETYRQHMSAAKTGKPWTAAQRAADPGLTDAKHAANEARRGAPPTPAQLAYWERMRKPKPHP